MGIRDFPELFKAQIKMADRGLCTWCTKPIGEFRDALSKTESKISGMCQKCQDSIFEDS